MNIDELKMVIDAITQLGMAGKEAFIWYVVAKYLLAYLLNFAGIMIGVLLAYRLLRDLIGNSYISRHHETIRDILGIGCRGIYTESEHIQVVNLLQKMKAQYKAAA